MQLTRIHATHWTITLTGLEGTQIDDKYALGSWDFVEKDGACGEIANRQLTLANGSEGMQTVNDTVPNWRNVPPCGNLIRDRGEFAQPLPAVHEIVTQHCAPWGLRQQHHRRTT